MTESWNLWFHYTNIVHMYFDTIIYSVICNFSMSMEKVFSFGVVSVTMANNQYGTRQVFPLFVQELSDQIPGTERYMSQ